LFSHPVERRGHRTVGAKAVPLLVSAAVAIEQLPVTQLHPVDGELLELLDAVAIHRDSGDAVWRLEHTAGVGVEPQLTLQRGPDHGG
jgi:hypothetical protein